MEWQWRAKHRDRGLEKSADSELVHPAARSFAASGVRTIICSLDELQYDRPKLRCGDFPIDLVYKRVVIHEFLARYDDTHPLIRAYVNHDVCLVNPFRCKIMHKKAVFEMLTEPICQVFVK